MQRKVVNILASKACMRDRPSWISHCLIRAVTAGVMLLFLEACSNAQRPYVPDSYIYEGTHFNNYVVAENLRFHSDRLTVYLGGDGEPWVAGRYPAKDPSSRDDLALRLHAMDEGPALFVGRPCYHGMARDSGCSADLWTTRRYGPEVIVSLFEAINAFARSYEPKQIVLVGFSGGGVLALAIAPMLEMPVYVITLGTNLDVGAWASWHGYLPIPASVDPASFASFYTRFPQLHLQGDEDQQVPPITTLAYLRYLRPEQYRVFDNIDHQCCWETIWPAILDEQPWLNF